MDEQKIRAMVRELRLQLNKTLPLAKEMIKLMKLVEELDNEVNGTRLNTTPIPPSKSDKVGKIIEFHKQ